MDRDTHDHHAGIRDDLLRAIPVMLFEDPHLITRQGEHFLEQPSHLTATADNHHRAQRRTQRLKPFIVLTGIGFTHHSTQYVFNQIWRYAERFRFGSARSQH
ncbi:hypothetical protein SDC9_183167 [bioreactor metagenome]|uniref:Uncharacterized protein n=1 Tax=bioreactor metagenome TaxID=1076179 RepID=A0A645HC21_9ZZZZ